mmetsp:Transcript_14649/g.44268  ORF Transcript_14649/g.44268 Transcript_14649/m.44268 type:complete len:82 (+) Transcript_14649:2603-2848(+)
MVEYIPAVPLVHPAGAGPDQQQHRNAEPPPAGVRAANCGRRAAAGDLQCTTASAASGASLPVRGSALDVIRPGSSELTRDH